MFVAGKKIYSIIKLSIRKEHMIYGMGDGFF